MRGLLSKIAKGVGMGLLFAGSFFSKANVQSTILNGPTPWEVLGNTYSQPNVGSRENGLDSLEWYGSGDVNLDGKVDSLDLQEMNQGVSNNMSDVDGDGTPSTQNDKNILNEYLNGTREYLPGDWNFLKTPEEREIWFSKMYLITDRLNGTPSGWVCADWINNIELKYYGLSNYEEALNHGFLVQGTNIDSVAKFNLPMYHFGTTNTSGVSHAVGGVLVGRRISSDSLSLNPLDFRDWYFISYQGTGRIHPGDFDIDPNHPVEMKKSAYVKNPVNGQNVFSSTGPWIKWDLNNGEPTLTYYWQNKLLLENPNIIKVHVGGLENLVVGAGGFPPEFNFTPSALDSLGYDAFPDTLKENTALPVILSYADFLEK